MLHLSVDRRALYKFVVWLGQQPSLTVTFALRHIHVNTYGRSAFSLCFPSAQQRSWPPPSTAGPSSTTAACFRAFFNVNRHEWCDAVRLHRSLTCMDPGSIYTKSSMARQSQPYGDETANYYMLELLHYGMKFVAAKISGKSKLLLP
jgi:hypothetical protein